MQKNLQKYKFVKLLKVYIRLEKDQIGLKMKVNLTNISN